MTDRPFFSYHARLSDPQTSHDAVPDNIMEQAWRVLLAYRNGHDLIDHDAYRIAGFDPKLARQRCSDLRRWKLIARTGARGVTPSGKSGYKCRITTAGLTYIKRKMVAR